MNMFAIIVKVVKHPIIQAAAGFFLANGVMLGVNKLMTNFPRGKGHNKKAVPATTRKRRRTRASATQRVVKPPTKPAGN